MQVLKNTLTIYNQFAAEVPAILKKREEEEKKEVEAEKVVSEAEKAKRETEKKQLTSIGEQVNEFY